MSGVFYIEFNMIIAICKSIRTNLTQVCFLEETCDPRKQRFDGYGLTTGKDGSHRLTGIKS